MRGYKEDREKDFECRKCSVFLDSDELIDCKCPYCGNEDTIFDNELLNEDKDEF